MGESDGSGKDDGVSETIGTRIRGATDNDVGCSGVQEVRAGRHLRGWRRPRSTLEASVGARQRGATRQLWCSLNLLSGKCLPM